MTINQEREAIAKRARMLEDLTWIVRYRRKDASGWITMAAFDQERIARNYAESCTGDGNRPWLYEAVELPEVSS